MPSSTHSAPFGSIIGDREHRVLDHVLVLKQMIERPLIGVGRIEIQPRGCLWDRDSA